MPRRSLMLITAHRKSTEWSALEKPVAPLTESAGTAGKFVLLFLCRFSVVSVYRFCLSYAGAGEGI
jgi:hypothetical protein